MGLYNESGVGFIGNSLTVDFDSTQDSGEVGNNSKSGRGPMDNPVCIKDKNDDDNDGVEETDSGSSGLDPSSDNDYDEYIDQVYDIKLLVVYGGEEDLMKTMAKK